MKSSMEYMIYIICIGVISHFDYRLDKTDLFNMVTDGKVKKRLRKNAKKHYDAVCLLVPNNV